MYLAFLPDYGFRNLYLKLSPSGADSTLMLSDTLVNILGEWNLDMAGGELPYTFPQALRLGPGQSVEVVQYMRKASLCGIRRVGMIRQP